MSNKGTFNQTQETSMGFQLWKLINQAGKTSNTPRGLKRSDMERKTSRDTVWDRQGSETGTKNILKTDGRTCRQNRCALGCTEQRNSGDLGRKQSSHKQRVRRDWVTQNWVTRVTWVTLEVEIGGIWVFMPGCSYWGYRRNLGRTYRVKRSD